MFRTFTPSPPISFPSILIASVFCVSASVSSPSNVFVTFRPAFFYSYVFFSATVASPLAGIVPLPLVTLSALISV